MRFRLQPEAIGILLVVAVAAIVVPLWFRAQDAASVREPAPPEEYGELEFVVLHRPHVTYLLDRRYRLCFATRKPDYQDLVQVQCTDRLLAEVMGLRARSPDAGPRVD